MDRPINQPASKQQIKQPNSLLALNRYQPINQLYNFQPKHLPNAQQSKQRNNQSTVQPTNRLASDLPLNTGTELVEFLNQTNLVQVRPSKQTIPNEMKPTKQRIVFVPTQPASLFPNIAK
jgi:hypothetical protein